MLETREAREYPRKVKLSVEKSGSTFWFPDEPRYKELGLFTFKKVKGCDAILHALQHQTSAV